MRVIDLDLPEIAEDEQAASLDRDQDPIRGRYAGVAWGLAERPAGDDHDEKAKAKAKAGAQSR